jgi:hypothetical protein
VIFDDKYFQQFPTDYADRRNLLNDFKGLGNVLKGNNPNSPTRQAWLYICLKLGA